MTMTNRSKRIAKRPWQLKVTDMGVHITDANANVIASIYGPQGEIEETAKLIVTAPLFAEELLNIVTKSQKDLLDTSDIAKAAEVLHLVLSMDLDFTIKETDYGTEETKA